MRVLSYLTVVFTFLVLGFMLGMMQRKLSEKRKIKKYGYTLHDSQRKDLSTRQSEMVKYADDGIEEHSEKFFRVPKDFEDEPESVDVNNESMLSAEEIQKIENNKNIINNINNNNALNIINTLNTINTDNAETDTMPVKSFQTEEEQAEMDNIMDKEEKKQMQDFEKTENF